MSDDTVRRLLEEAEKRNRQLEEETKQLRRDKDKALVEADSAHTKALEVEVDLNKLKTEYANAPQNRTPLEAALKVEGFRKAVKELVEASDQLGGILESKETLLEIRGRLKRLEEAVPKVADPLKATLTETNADLAAIDGVLKQVVDRFDALATRITGLLEPSQAERDAMDALVRFTQGR